MSAIPLELKDTFGVWRTKINDLVTIINQSEGQIADLMTKTPFAVTSFTGLNLTVLGGRVRDGSDVETVANATKAVSANKTSILVLKKSPGVPAELQVHLLINLPTENVIPLYSITTNASTVTSLVDLRTAYNTASGSAGSASSVLQFDRIISSSITIPDTRNGLSIDPVVNSGVNVIVSEGSTWVVL